MSKFSQFFDAVLDGAKSVAGDSARAFLKEATTDNGAFKLRAEADLKRWTKLLANGDINKDDYASLVRGQWSEAALAALLKSGIAAQKAAEVRDKLIDIAVSAAFTILL